MTFSSFRLGDVLDIQWGDTNTTKASYVESGFLAYSAAGPDGFLAKYDYDQEGVVLSAIGANCGVTYFASGKWSCIKNTIRILPNSSEIDIRFFYYLSTLPNFWPKRGSAQPFISQTDIRDMEIAIPPMDAQLAVVRICKALDEKKLVNDKLISVLEDAAHRLFQSWFVDFDPIHEKSMASPSALKSSRHASLFPDSFVDSILGSIPKGWSVAKIGDVLDIRGGSTPSTSNSAFWGSNYRWTTPKDLSALTSLASLDSARKLTGDGLRKIKSGLLPKFSVLLSSRAPIGYVAITDEETATNQGIIGLGAHHSYSPLYLASWLLQNMQEIKSRAGGSSFAEISKSSFKEIPFLVPDSGVTDEFSRLCKPMLELIINLSNQNRLLEDLRVSLLKRLISGELVVPRGHGVENVT